MNAQICDFEGWFAAQLAATPRGARQARRLAVEKSVEWGVPSEGPALIVAELAANAVTHGRAPGRDFRMLLTVGGGVLLIEVVDTRGDRVPVPRDSGGGVEGGGRGLVLVEAVADRWGVDRGLPPCKSVWAEVDVAAGWQDRDAGNRDPVRSDATPKSPR
ncbi:ATP-binding protein [Streptomyces sp. NPDC048337]|uniref:ATP-binding protein n=1 Tax=Streptomyces sp. NPDC048337 TaxID=3365535 RepID=UPI00371EDF89